MALIAAFGDYGLSDTLAESQALYDLLLALCEDQLDWGAILNKPELYEKSETYSKEQVDDLLQDIAPGDHTHDIADVGGLQSALDNRYTETEVDDLLNEKSDVGHTHVVADITDFESAITGLGIQTVTELPLPVVNGKVYILHPTGASRFSTFISAGGVYVPLDAVTYSALSIALAAYQTKLSGLSTQYVKGDGTYGNFNKAAIGLGDVENYSPSGMPLSTAAVAALLLKADNSQVLNKTENQTKTSGVLEFMVSPVVPTPAGSGDAANKGYVDSQVQDSVKGELEYIFDTPAEEWIINHNLNRRPIPNIIIGGKQAGSNVEYIDNDILKIIHSKPLTGIVTIK